MHMHRATQHALAQFFDGLPEQVCLSYIDESASYSERQAALRDYGFSCECEKCIEEATSRGKGQA